MKNKSSKTWTLLNGKWSIFSDEFEVQKDYFFLPSLYWPDLQSLFLYLFAFEYITKIIFSGLKLKCKVSVQRKSLTEYDTL